MTQRRNTGPEMRAACRSIAVLIACSLSLSATAALAASSEMNFAKGVVAFSRGDLHEAESRFRDVLGISPDNAQAVYYLGQAQLGLGKIEAAAGSFRRAVELSPTNHAIRLDLALALTKAGNFSGAEEVLLAAKEALDTRASLHYYLGLCRYRLGKYHKALEALERARDLDQGFAAAAGYYQGMAQFKLGRQEEALRSFRRSATFENADRRLSALARRNVYILAGEQAGSSRRAWGAFASVGGGYDSNVTLDPQQPGNAASATAFVSAGGYFRPTLGTRDRLDLRLRLFRSFHAAEKTRGYNLTEIAAGLGWDHRIGDDHLLSLAYHFGLDMLDGPAQLRMNDFGVYMQGHTAKARFRIGEGEDMATTLTYSFEASLFHELISERDNFHHQFTAAQDVSLAGDRLWLRVSAGMAAEDARGSFYDLWGPQVELNVRLRVVDALGMRVGGGWYREKHWNANRADDRWTASAGADWRLGGHVTLGASYNYINNDSNLPGYSYARHMLSVAVLGWF